MIVLTLTTDTIKAVLAGAVTTNQPLCFASYRDITTSGYTPGRNALTTNNTTDVNVVAAPAASTQRVIDYVSIYNADTVAATVTIKFDAVGSQFTLYKAVLGVGEKVEYVDGQGFRTLDAIGTLKVG